MVSLGKLFSYEKDAATFAPRRGKDVMIERLFAEQRRRFTALDLVFLHRSINLEGWGGDRLGCRGSGKDYWPKLPHMEGGPHR